MIKTPHGDKFHFSMNKVSMARPAPRPSNTAPKVSAAKIIHINMQETPRVFLRVVSKTFLLNLPLKIDASVANKAPTAEHSTRLAIPIKNKPVIKKKITKGTIPAFNNLIFSIKGTSLSLSGSIGPRFGCNLHLI